MSLTLISHLPLQYREALEEILFFNPGQHSARLGIEKSVEKYGLPQIYENDGRIGIRTEKFTEFQCLYALDKSKDPAVLAGVLVFVRDPLNTLEALHLAVSEPYAAHHRGFDQSASYQLIDQLLRIGAKVKGVERVGISCYRSNRRYFLLGPSN